jgi:hypothetical protein
MNNYHKSKENHKLNLNVQGISHKRKIDLLPVSQLYNNTINLLLSLALHLIADPPAIRLHTT